MADTPFQAQFPQQPLLETADWLYQSSERLTSQIHYAAQAIVHSVTSGGRVFCAGEAEAHTLARQAAALLLHGTGRERPPLAAHCLTPALAAGEATLDQQLRALLQARKLPPPYVLVGHSLGGLYMQLFARQYPGEVAALVLVDSTHPDQMRGAGNPDLWPTWLKVAFRLSTSDVVKQELAALDATGQLVASLPVDPAVPVFVLSALRTPGASPALADDVHRKRADIAHLYPGSTQVWVDSGHGIPLEKPEAVVQAIRDAVQAARAPRVTAPGCAPAAGGLPGACTQGVQSGG